MDCECNVENELEFERKLNSFGSYYVVQSRFRSGKGMKNRKMLFVELRLEFFV